MNFCECKEIFNGNSATSQLIKDFITLISNRVSNVEHDVLLAYQYLCDNLDDDKHSDISAYLPKFIWGILESIEKIIRKNKFIN